MRRGRAMSKKSCRFKHWNTVRIRAIGAVLCMHWSVFLWGQANSVQQSVMQAMQAQQRHIEELKRGIVRIEVQKDVKETGTGFVLSSTPDTVTILTALHVVSGAQSINVVFYDDQSRRYVAQKLPKHSAGLDLAVLQIHATPSIRVPANLPKFNFVANSNLQVTQHLWSVNGYWVVVPNNITRLSHDGDPQKFEYSNVSVDTGFSGGPIFDDYTNIIGMHDARSGDGSYAIGIKIDSALQVLEALDYSVPEAGPTMIPGITDGQPNQTAKAPNASPCENGCETTLGSLKRVQQYSSASAGMSCREYVYTFPPDWPGAGLFMHLQTCAYSRYGRSAGNIILRFAQTDRQNDQDMMLGLAMLQGSSGQGTLRDPNGGYWSLTIRDPNFGGTLNVDALSIGLKPLGGVRR